jgi:rhamnose transport system permease protein
VFLALGLLGTIQTGMQLANIPGTSQTLVIGVLLVGSIGVPRIAQLIRGRFAANRASPLTPTTSRSAP